MRNNLEMSIIFIVEKQTTEKIPRTGHPVASYQLNILSLWHSYSHPEHASGSCDVSEITSYRLAITAITSYRLAIKVIKTFSLQCVQIYDYFICATASGLVATTLPANTK